MTLIEARFQLPAEVRQRVEELGAETLEALDTDMALARQLAATQLHLIRASEREVGQSLHKGQPLHNLGAATYWTSPGAALSWFVAAHIEDARSTSDATFIAPAGTTLAEVYGYPPTTISAITDRARESSTTPPSELALLILSEGGTSSFDAPVPTPDDEGELPDREQLVFVGGTYNGGWERIREMAWGVRDAGLRPVVVKAFPDRGRSPRTKSLDLLKRCSLAVFDGSNQVKPGWWPEIIEIAKNPIPTLVTFSTDRLDREPPWSEMLPAKDDIPGLEFRGYDAAMRQRSQVGDWVRLQRPLVGRTGLGAIGATGVGFDPSWGANGSNTRYDERQAVGSGGSAVHPCERLRTQRNRPSQLRPHG